MTIATLPPAPNPNDPGTFNARAAAWVAALDAFVTEANALSVELNTLALAVGPGIFQSGTVDFPSITFEGDRDTGFYRPGTNQIVATTNGIQRWLLSNTALTVDLPIQGTAVTQSISDATAGRLMKVGDFGLGALTSADVDPNLTNNPTRLFRGTGANTLDGGSWHMLHISRALNAQSAQLAIIDTSASGASLPAVRHRDALGAWSAWNLLFGRRNILGTVGQSSGVPTGALIERGSNGNGEFVRFADGLQICTRSGFALGAINVADGTLFKSAADASVTFPAAFVAAPVVSGGSATDSDVWITPTTETATTASLRGRSTVSKATGITGKYTAIGRWF